MARSIWYWRISGLARLRERRRAVVVGPAAGARSVEHEQVGPAVVPRPAASDGIEEAHDPPDDADAETVQLVERGAAS